MFSAKEKQKQRTGKATAYESHRRKQGQKQEAISREGREIGPLPKCVNSKGRAKCAKDFGLFCRTYFPQTFVLPWSNDHLKAVARIQDSLTSGGLYAYALPRGSGKTSLAEAAALYAMLYGLRKFPVIIGSDESSALELLESIKSELESNERLAEDFPEVCYPIQRLEGIAHRCNGQLLDGKRTQMHWSAKAIVLPTVPDSHASAVVVAVAGITGRIRGMKFKRPDGKSVRPDFVIIDDPQTDESAKSPSQCAERVRIVAGAVLGLAGPGKKISGVMPCTVIHPGDMADQILDRKIHPEWQGERAKLIYKFPQNETLWEEYRKQRADGLRAGDGGKAATEFYRTNREAMDAGSIVAWPERLNPDDVSALQHAMNLRYDLGEGAFFSEYQNEPIAQQKVDLDALTVDQVSSKVNGRERGNIPTGCNRVVSFIDVQKNVLYWTVAAFEDEFTGYVIDYGTFPDQRREHFAASSVKHTLQRWARENGRKTAGLEEIIYAGLEALTADLMSREWKRDDGANLKIERCPIDANWGESSDIIYRFCRESVHAAIVVPSHGRGVGAKNKPFSEYHRNRGDRTGLNWRMPAVDGRRSVRYLIYDTNWWKSFLHKRLFVPQGGRGCMTIFGREQRTHQMFAEHIVSENPIPVTANGRTVLEFVLPPSRPDNHWLDCLVGCCVAASVQGVTLTELTQNIRPRKVVSVKELQTGARHHGAGAKLNG